jgi:hypothetical protein
MGKRLQAAGVKRQLTIADLRARPHLRLRWPDFGRTTTLKVGAYCASVNSIPPGQQVYVPLGEMAETPCGSEGWGSSPSERDQVSGLSPGSGGAFLLTPLLTSAVPQPQSRPKNVGTPTRLGEVETVLALGFARGVAAVLRR